MCSYYYAASGVNPRVNVLRVRVSPLATVFGAVSCTVHSALPAEIASHKEMSVIVSPVVIDHDGAVPDMTSEPTVEVVHVTVTRVTTADAAVAAAAPGLAVCNFTNEPTGAVYAVALIMFSQALACAVIRPSAIR
jgi:hypothetical protein